MDGWLAGWMGLELVGRRREGGSFGGCLVTRAAISEHAPASWRGMEMEMGLGLGVGYRESRGRLAVQVPAT